jgi:hypothetical protein
VGLNILIFKSVLGEACYRINRQRRNRVLQRVGMPQSIQFYPLWRGLNGPMEIVPVINAFLAVLEHRSNSQDASNGHIASPWKSSSLCFFAIPVRFKFYKPSFYEVLSGTSCNFSIFTFFLLSFISFFSVICVSRFLFPFLFLSSLSIVTSHN